jgi:2,3-bisphosphoglycerate-independent phosphoglycerate mutase
MDGRRGLSEPASVSLRGVVLVFLDGVGLGSGDPARNPLAAASLPRWRALLGGARPLAEEIGEALLLPGRGGLRPIDATLGVAGRPQSGTGQTALLTGENAPALLGRHFGPWVPTSLRGLLSRRSLFRLASEAGHRTCFANAYPTGHLEPGGRGARRPGAFPLAARAADLLVRDERSLRAGDALPSSITTDVWRRHVDPGAPAIDPAEAGARLARLADRHVLTIFAHYDTDYVGHRGGLAEGIAVIERVDAFLGSLASHLPADTLLLLTSDHGNLEDVSTGHTRNHVPLLALGPEGERVLRDVRTLSDVAPTIMRVLGERPAGPLEVGAS